MGLKSEMNRSIGTRLKIRTPFGAMYIHIEKDEFGRPVDGAISHRGKEPESQISKLVEDLSRGLSKVLSK